MLSTANWDRSAVSWLACHPPSLPLCCVLAGKVAGCIQRALGVRAGAAPAPPAAPQVETQMPGGAPPPSQREDAGAAMLQLLGQTSQILMSFVLLKIYIFFFSASITQTQLEQFK